MIAGRKLWLVFDPITPEDIACGKPFMTSPSPYPNIENEAVGWFHRVWPRLVKYLVDNNLCGKYRPRMLIQYPGETIFMPGGVWHYVLNLDDSLAVTQNYCNMSNFGLCWREMRIERRHTALRWLAMLQRRFPLAAKLAKELDTMDKFQVELHKPHVVGTHRKLIDKLKQKRITDGADKLTVEEIKQIEQYDISHDVNKVWGESEQPFQYGKEWELWSGSTDSSTDSEESSSSDDDSDDSSDSD